MSNFKGQRVLITGAAKGIGRHLAKEIGAAGGELILTDIDDDALSDTAVEIRSLGVTVHTRRVDVADRKEVEEMAAWVEKDLGGLDILVNNAGLGHSGDLGNTSIETWEKLLAVNFWGPLYHIHAFLPNMKQRRSGQIVNVSSGQAFWRIPSWGAYAIIKLALGVLSEMLHFELRRHKVVVTTVYPFMVNTGFYGDIAPKSRAGRLSVKLVPYYSMTPEKVARVIFRAIRNKARIERVTVINSMGLLLRAMPPVSNAITTGAAFLMADRDEQTPSSEERPAA